MRVYARLIERKMRVGGSMKRKRIRNDKGNKWLAVAAGAAIGLLCGAFGGGGGMLAVPVLERLYGLKERNAHATAVFVILPLCLVSVTGYLSRGSMETWLLLPTVLGMTVGGMIGSRLLGRCSGRMLNMLFSIVLSSSGIYMLVRSIISFCN